ncbi:coiled-coil domain-containing protein 158-like isoform X2 [Cyclopterus lumpus]|uniref:coiled-coil domain-containing protein 158-like isoform X2 n=1 Tax=Cyclopterus lumpus TaxID=8103 RepID=UPI001485C4B8|nr:coiled-coil domain-containing protein 158-like isoform X2 [Cyclopterus lumpus]
MSSESRPSDPQVSSNNHVLHFESPPTRTQLAQGANVTTETRGASPRLRLNSLTLDELSEDLDRRTKETQRLQEEVENETKITLERFGYSYGIHSSPERNSLNHSNYYVSPEDSTTPSPHQQPETQHLVCDVESMNQGDFGSPGKEASVNAIDDCVLLLSDLQLDTTCDQPDQETFSFTKAIVNLQAEWHKVQNEKDVLSNLRVKDSRTHVGQMEKMLLILEEHQDTKRTEEQKLQEAELEDEASAFGRKVETLEQNVKEMYSRLSQEAQCRVGAIASPNATTTSRQLSPAASLTEDSNNESEKLQERPFPSMQHLWSEESGGENRQNERMEDLIESLGQEMALLTDKLISSKNNSFSLSVKLEKLKKLAERQTLLHRCQVSELESTLCSHTDKVCCLELQLSQAQSQLLDAQRERERSLQQAEELRSRLDQFKALLEQRAQEGETSQELLEEKKKELQLCRHEAQHHLARLEEAQSRCQTLLAEGETLRLKLDEREKMMESSLQMHNSTINDLHQENSLLRNQLNQHKLEIQELRAELDRHKSDLAAAEQDRLQLQTSEAEQRLRVQEETLENQQLTIQMDIQCLQLLTLTKEHEELRQLHSCKNEEHKGAVLKLQSQLRNTHDELDQFRCTLRTLKGADGHGLQVAMDMQKEITARREQVDSLQCKIQYLEENKDKMYQEKHYQSLENQRQLQALTFIREEKRQLGNELEALRSKDKQLREWIGQLEAILHTMTESFADCQDFFQLKEQDFFRLKLQHALDLKELQGQNLHTALNVPPSDLDSPSPSALTAPPASQHASNTQITECRAWELRSLVRDLRGVISENHRPHTDNRRRSAPDRVHRTALSTDKAEEVKADSRLRRKTCGSEPHFPKAAELNGKMTSNKSCCESCVISRPATAVRFASSPQLLALGRRSPVYSLLTSDPNS